MLKSNLSCETGNVYWMQQNFWYHEKLCFIFENFYVIQMLVSNYF